MTVAAYPSPMLPASYPDSQAQVSLNGVSYGAEGDARGPIGGGPGTQPLFTHGDYTVHTLSELAAALKDAKPGQVIFVPGTVVFDFTELTYTDKLVLELPGGVTLASDRGAGASAGALFYSDAFQTRPLIRIMGPDATISGLRIQGPDHKIRHEHHDRAFAMGGPGHEYYYRFPVSEGIRTEFDRLTVANCELSGWSHSAVYLYRGHQHQVHHCDIHHNQYNGLGYGVCLDIATALIERNRFNHNRHDIAGTGRSGSGYEACHNVVLRHDAYSHHFDMHGGSDRKDGSNIASDWLRIHHNAFHGSGRPIVIRGTPNQQAEIHHNFFPRHRPALDPEELLTWVKESPVHTLGNTLVRDNAYGVILTT
jgi:hypothetical protein